MRPTILIPCLLTLITVVTLTRCSVSAQSLNGYKPTEVAHNLGSLQDDPGVDLCIVISTKANLREGPGTTSAVIRQLERGEVLALVSRSAVGPWFHVIHI